MDKIWPNTYYIYIISIIIIFCPFFTLCKNRNWLLNPENIGFIEKSKSTPNVPRPEE